MIPEIIIVFGLILLAIVLFVLDSVPFDLVAMILMSALSKGIQKTGVLSIVSRHFGKIGRLSLPTAVLIIMGIIALISAFINNKAAVVIFIPVLMTTAARMEISPSKLLLPLSFASMFGGVCTLLGTSTNTLVSFIAADNGLEPFAMFEFTPFGLIILTAGFIYPYVLDIIGGRRSQSK